MIYKNNLCIKIIQIELKVKLFWTEKTVTAWDKIGLTPTINILLWRSLTPVHIHVCHHYYLRINIETLPIKIQIGISIF